MKKLFLLLITIGALTSCEKHNDKSTPCPIVSADAVPKVVTDAFALKYAAETVTTWYNVDGKAYCAQFTKNGTDTYAHFATDGTFQEEKSPGVDGDNVQQTGNNQDTSCDCGSESGDEND